MEQEVAVESCPTVRFDPPVRGHHHFCHECLGVISHVEPACLGRAGGYTPACPDCGNSMGAAR